VKLIDKFLVLKMFFMNYGLETLFFFLIISIIVLCFINKNNYFYLRNFTLFSAGVIFLQSCHLLFNFDFNNNSFQYCFNLFSSYDVNINFAFGLDSLSILFIVLTTLLIFVSILFI